MSESVDIECPECGSVAIWPAGLFPLSLCTRCSDGNRNIRMRIKGTQGGGIEYREPSYEERLLYIKELWRREEAEKAASEARGDPSPETIRIQCPKCREQSDWPAGKPLPSCAGCFLRYAEWPRMLPADVAIPEPRPKKPTMGEKVEELSAQIERLAAALERLDEPTTPD